MDRATPAPGSVLAQYAALGATWGASFLFVRIGLEGLSPAQVVLGRLVAGALALAVISSLTGQRLPARRATWLHLTVVAVLLCVLPFSLFAWAQQHLPSGLASIYNATTPLMTLAVAVLALPDERPTRTRTLGLTTGLAGVLVVLAPWHGPGSVDAVAQGACLLATASYGLAFVYLRRHVSPLGLRAIPVATVQVGIAATIAAVLAPWTATGPVHLTPRVIGSVLTLGLLGTGLAYVWNTNVVAGWGATNAATVTYLTPVVGVLLGALVLGETLSWNEPLGGLLVIVGIAISQGRLPALTTAIRRRTGAGRAGPGARTR